MEDFFKSQLCHSRTQCVRCRTEEKFRLGIVASFDNVDDPNFPCPYNITKGNIGKKLDAGEIKYPPMMTQFANAGKAMLRTIVASVSGESIRVSNEEQDRRMELCRQCEFYVSKQDRCKKCGCKARFKARLTTEHCPIDTW